MLQLVSPKNDILEDRYTSTSLQTSLDEERRTDCCYDNIGDSQRGYNENEMIHSDSDSDSDDNSSIITIEEDKILSSKSQEQEQEQLPSVIIEGYGLIKHISSYLSLDDLESITQFQFYDNKLDNDEIPPDIIPTTPPSPNEPNESDEEIIIKDKKSPSSTTSTTSSSLIKSTKTIKQKDLRKVLFSHPGSIRSYFTEHISLKESFHVHESSPKTQILKKSFLHKMLFRNIPLSILFQFIESVLEVSVNTSISIYKITEQSLFYIIDLLTKLLQPIWNMLESLYVNPYELLNAITNFYKNNIFGKEAIVIKSTSGASFSQHDDISIHSIQTAHSKEQKHVLSAKLFSKLQKRLQMDISTSRVISYIEGEEEMMNEHAKMRVQRMMHYNVSLRPFVAKVIVNDNRSIKQEPSIRTLLNTSSSNIQPQINAASSNSLHTAISKQTNESSPFMQTPSSFPPSPSSRSLVMDRSTRFAEDVLFLARTQLRNENNRCSEDARTRAMANALHDGCRFAIWNAMDTNSSVVLNCGQHVATKVSGSVLYGSSRSMVPLLRNCFVYFEISILSSNTYSSPSGMASLCLGLSTLDMPLNTLVGAWKSSIGLCTTGQILISGQWCSSSFTNNGINTIGCLAYIDDDSAFETWDGVIVNASIIFNVNRSVIIPSFQTSPTKEEQTQQQTTLRILLPKNEELYPTITLHSLGTQVKCHFCNDDITPIRNYSDIGAPNTNTPIYCLDGSILTFCDNAVEDELLDEDDDTSLDDDSFDYSLLHDRKCQYSSSL